MAVHFVLDGYNIIKQNSFLANLPLEAGREKLIQLITVRSPQGSFKNKVTVVFDGKLGLGGDHKNCGVNVVFSWDESADDVIKRLVAEDGNKKSIVVVTNDREIQYYVRALGAAVWSVSAFVAKLEPPGVQKAKSPTKATSGDDPKDISKVLESQINSEFEKIWLKEKT